MNTTNDKITNFEADMKSLGVPEHLRRSRHWRPILFMFSQTTLKWCIDRFFDFKKEEIDIDGLQRVGISSGEATMVNLGLHLLNEKNSLPADGLHSLCGLDDHCYEVAIMAIHMRCRGLAFLQSATPINLPSLNIAIDRSGGGVDLSGLDLSGLNLIGLDLSGVNLRKADFNGATLKRAKFFKADLSKADLFEADLSEATLKRTKLFEADLSEATLKRANLFEADLSKANLFEADLSGATLKRAKLFKADLSEATLSGANLSEANLSRANLSGAKYNALTIWPEGFDIAGSGAINIDEPGGSEVEE